MFMIQSVTIVNDVGESITLDLFHPEQSGLIIEEIEGLGPPKANLNFTELALLDGSTDNFARVESRNIVVSFIFIENPTIEDTRLLTYKYFPIKKTITFVVETNNRICKIDGRIESNAPNIFDERESTQISILCPNPYFQSLSPYITDFSGVEAMFEFEFENESVTSDEIIVSEIIEAREKIINYTGDVDTGLKLTIHAIGEVRNPIIYKIETREVFAIDTQKLHDLTGNGFNNGDDIIIDTTKGHKSVQLLRNGIYTNVLNCVDRKADWFQLTHGRNTFVYTAAYGYENVEFIMENDILYEGV